MPVALGTNKTHHWGHITVKVLNAPSWAEGQREDKGHQLEGQAEAEDHGGHHQVGTKRPRHYDRVLQRVADGSVAVVRHGS